MMYASSRNPASASLPLPIAMVDGFDGIDTDYTFGVYDINALPSGANAVYMFCKVQNNNYMPLYIGRAEDLSGRLSDHERKLEAIQLGARYLLVHTPLLLGARVHYIEAERRLIRKYNPILNTQHRTLGSILGSAI